MSGHNRWRQRAEKKKKAKEMMVCILNLNLRYSQICKSSLDHSSCIEAVSCSFTPLPSPVFPFSSFQPFCLCFLPQVLYLWSVKFKKGLIQVRKASFIKSSTSLRFRLPNGFSVLAKVISAANGEVCPFSKRKTITLQDETSVGLSIPSCVLQVIVSSASSFVSSPQGDYDGKERTKRIKSSK